jgi:uncharacterized LabA/DUF88 family protein
LEQNYFFFDGSALLYQIRRLQEQRGIYKGHRLDPLQLMRCLANAGFMRDLIAVANTWSFKRAVFYFAAGDESVERLIQVPDATQPSLVRDVGFKFCGARLPRSKEFDEFVATDVPEKFRDRFSKSEKGVDIEICCDALQLAATGRLDRLLLLTNDSDFLPLVRKLKEFGANVSLMHLSSASRVNGDLASLCDSFDVIPDEQLPMIFNLPKRVNQA